MNNREYVAPLLVSAALTAAVGAGMMFVSVPAGCACLALGAAITAVFAFFTVRRIRRIRMLNDYLALICSGQFDLNAPDNDEGELSILRNNLYKVISLLRYSNDSLARDKTALADSLADISHQIKTPLTSMTVLLDLLEEETDPDKRTEYIRLLGSQLTHVNSLIRSLLRLSKLDAGTVEFAMDSVTIAAVAKKALEPLLILMDLKGVELKNEIVDFEFTGDASWTAEAVGNIIKNCVEHTPQGGSVTLSTDSTALYNELTITDTGCGIPEDELEHIFERFYRGSGGSAESVGIGLALAKTVLEREGGSISAESVVDEGTTFRLRFYNAVV